MPEITVSVNIPAPVEVVWRDVADLGSHVQWMADAESIEFLDDRREGVGTSMRVMTRVGPLRTADILEVTVWDPPFEMGIVHSGLITGSGRFTLAPVGDRTRFTWTEVLSFPWWLGGPITGLVARPILSAVWRRNLGRLSARF